MLKPVCLLQKISTLEDSKIRTWSFGLCPGRALASCFGWWWGAGVQPKSERFSLFELLKKIKKRHSENMSVQHLRWDILGESPSLLTCAPFCQASERRDCKVRWSLLSWLLKLFHGPLYPCSVLYSGAEEPSLRWLHPRHWDSSTSSVTLNPLVSFRLSSLNAFDFVWKTI